MPLSSPVDRALPLPPARPARSKRPTVAEQVRKTGAPASSALAKLIRDNQDIELLHPDELNDGYPTPLWLRVVWRKQHPEIAMPVANTGAAYPETLSQIYRRMVANPEQPWGPTAKPLVSSKAGYVAALSAAVLSGVACIAALIEPRRPGLVVAVSLAACLCFGLLAWRERRRGRREAAARAVIVKDLA